MCIRDSQGPAGRLFKRAANARERLSGDAEQRHITDGHRAKLELKSGRPVFKAEHALGLGHHGCLLYTSRCV